MDVNSHVNGLHSEPAFHPEARYEFKVHFDGADFETLTYRVSFNEPGPDGAPSPAAARPRFRRRRHRDEHRGHLAHPGWVRRYRGGSIRGPVGVARVVGPVVEQHQLTPAAPGAGRPRSCTMCRPSCSSCRDRGCRARPGRDRSGRRRPSPSPAAAPRCAPGGTPEPAASATRTSSTCAAPAATAAAAATWAHHRSPSGSWPSRCDLHGVGVRIHRARGTANRSPLFENPSSTVCSICMKPFGTVPPAPTTRCQGADVVEDEIDVQVARGRMAIPMHGGFYRRLGSVPPR